MVAQRVATVDSIALDDLPAALAEQVDGEVRFDAGSRAAYAHDGSNYRQVPIGVVVPRTVDAAVAAIALCRRAGAPVLSRGGGTSLAGQCCNEAVVIDWTKYCHRVVSVDPGARTAIIEPGAALDKVNDALAEHGLMVGPKPSTHVSCTIGGMIGNNSCGATAQAYGKMADSVRRLEIVTYDGLRTWVGETSDEEYESILAEGGGRAELYRRLREIRDTYLGQIRTGYPDIPRRVSGYNLDHLRHHVGGIRDVRVPDHHQGPAARYLHQADLRLEHGDQRALAAHQRPGQVEALLREQIVEVVAGNPAGDLRIAGADLAEVAVPDLPQPPVQLGPAAARGQDLLVLLVAGGADPAAQPVVGQDLQPAHGVRHLAVGLGRGTARVVADHAADGAAHMGGRAGADHQPVARQRVVHLVQRRARLHHGRPGRRVGRFQPVAVLGPVDHHCLVAALPGQAGAAAAGQHRHVVLPAHRERGHRRVDVPGHHHPDRDLAVVGGVGGVRGAGAGVEPDFPVHLLRQCGRQPIRMPGHAPHRPLSAHVTGPPYPVLGGLLARVRSCPGCIRPGGAVR